MIKKTAKNTKKRYISIAVTAAVLVLLISAYIIVEVILSGLSGGSPSQSIDPPEVMSGESVYGNSPIVYPALTSKNILAVRVDKNLRDEETDEVLRGEDGKILTDTFMMSKPKDDKGERTDHFIFSYISDPLTNDIKVYYPEILYEDAYTDYSDLYSVEQSTGLNLRKIEYLCAAVGVLYFDNRIMLSDKAEEKAAQLNRYGLSEEDRETVTITYADDKGIEKRYTVHIGNKLITGIGYYFMLDGRDCIYTSSSSEALSYALDGFENFIDSRLIPEGTETDSTSAPYFTKEYSQWISKYYTLTEGSTEIPVVKQGSEVILNAKYIQPIFSDIKDESNTTPGFGSGYRYSDFETFTLTGGSLDPLLNFLVGKEVGRLDENLFFSVVFNMNSAELFDEEKNTGVYEYTIHKIEAIVTDEGDVSAEGTAVSAGDRIIVEYSYTLDGKTLCKEHSHAVIDLSKDSAIPEDIRSFLESSAVGTLAEPKTFTVKYTEDNADTYKIEYVISEISLILDKDGKVAEKITDTSVVNFEYYYLLNGEKMGESSKRTLFLEDITSESGDYEIKKLLLNKTRDDRLFGTTTRMYSQAFMDFGTYEISEIEGFISLEEVVKFSYTENPDPFHGGSLTLFKNLLPESNKYSVYAMDEETCTQILQLLSGIEPDSAGAAGLVGKETVAAGLSHATMEKYGLYEGYRVRLNLPRGKTSSGQWLDYINFTLYIGKEVQPDGTLYVASDMYDTVVKIDASTFDYLEFSFPELWAKRNLVLISANDIENISVKLDYEDLYGEYDFGFAHKNLYITSDGESYTIPTDSEGNVISHDIYDIITVTVKSLSDRRTDTLFSSLINKLSSESGEKADSYGLNGIYNNAAGIDGSSGNVMSPGSYDTLATASMRDMIFILSSTYCIGVLDGDSQASVSDSDKLMELSFDLTENADRTDSTLKYEFYRVSDRKIMVRLYKVSDSGVASASASDLYISDFAFKKIVSGFVTLLNGEEIDTEKAY